jgi:zinc protease
VRRLIALSLLAAVAAHAGPTRTILPNGLRLITAPESGTEWVVVSASLRLPAGPGPEAAVRLVTAQAAYLSHKDLPQSRLGELAAQIGGGVRVYAERDHIRYEVFTTRPWVQNALFLITGALRNPTFAEDTVKQATEAVGPAVEVMEAPAAFGVTQLVNRILGDHPYAGRPMAEEVAAVSPADCAEYHKTHFSPERVCLVVAGAIDAKEVTQSVTKSLRSWPRASGQVAEAPPIPKLAEPFDRVVQTDTRSAYLTAGFCGPPPTSEWFPALAVLASALGKGQRSALAQGLREEGMAYQVGSSLLPTPAGTLVYAWVQFSPLGYDPESGGVSSRLGETRDKAKEALASALGEELTEEQVERAKRMLIVDYVLSDPQARHAHAPFLQGHQRLRDRAYWLGWWETIGGGFEMDARFPEVVEKVTREQVVQVARSYAEAMGTVLTIPEQP